MNKNAGPTVRPSYGRVLMSEAKKFLEDMDNDDSPEASVPGVATDPANTNPLSGVPIVDTANKENRADYAFQLLGSSGSDSVARNSIYGPARFVTASNQAYLPKSSVLLPSKPVAKAEDVRNIAPSSTADATRASCTEATRATALHTYDPPKLHQSSQSAEDGLRNPPLNPRLVEKTRQDSAAMIYHSNLTDELRPMQTPFSQKHTGYSRVPISYQMPDFHDNDDDDDFGKKTSGPDVSHTNEDLENSFSGFVEPSSAVRARGDERTATKNPLTALNFSELMASLEINKQKVKKMDFRTSDRNDLKFERTTELFNTGDTFSDSIYFPDTDDYPLKPQHHTDSSMMKENLSHPARLDKSASASNLFPRRSRASESESLRMVETYRKPAQMSEISSAGGEIHRKCVRNPDSVNVVTTQDRSTKNHEFLSAAGQKSSTGQESSSTFERSQRSTLVRDALNVGSASQRLANGVCSVTNPPRSLSSLLPDMKTLIINGNIYVLLRVIGKGGSSKVYKAIGPDCRDCAVKCVSFVNAEESMISGYRNEIRLLQQLQNSTEVVKLYDFMFDEDADMLYVAMECGEMDLQTFFRIKESQMRIFRMFIRPYWIQMLHAVQVLHKQGIVHSDLKPANFIVVCGQIKLIDFGIARTVMPDCTSVVCDEIVGTFNYISPEAVTDLNGGRDLTGESKPNVKISTRSDVWSLGCILYYLVYSHTPFEHIRNPIMKLQAIMNPGYKIEYPVTKIPHVVDVMKRCLDRNPKNRPTIEELLEHPYVTSD